jgi:hypothetical protein
MYLPDDLDVAEHHTASHGPREEIVREPKLDRIGRL